MSTLCVSAIKAKVARFVKLDTCGVPVSGASSAVAVTNGFIKISPSPEYEEGKEYLSVLADGSPCINQRDPAFLKRVKIEAEFCVLDPDGIVIMTGERLLTTGSTTGTGVAFGEGLLEARFSLEVWQPVAGTGACVGGLPQYVYWAFMNLGNAMVGDFSFERSEFSWKVKAETMATTATAWGTGPGTGTKYAPAVQDGEHFLYNVTTSTPPTSYCGSVALS